jgi:RhtB (resistance to homoserine/threonine) family protein
MENFLPQLLTVAVVHLLAVMSPGPDFVIVTKNSLSYSRKIGIFTSLGVALGIIVHVTYSLLGIGFLISQSVVLFTIIKLLGAGYLVWIGIKALRSKPSSADENQIVTKEKNMTVLGAIRNGFFVNVLNPKATLFFLALFTQVINPSTPKSIQLVYGIEMVTATFVWFTVVAYFFSHSKLKIKIKKISHYIDRVTGLALIALGVKVALSSKN